ncbi:MAG: DUF1015 domain-containing protein [Sarcina sp.]
MVKIKAFKAIRPDVKFVDKVAALPYDVMNTEEARELVKDNEYSFLRVDRAEINFKTKINPYDKSVYKKAHDVLEEMIKSGVLKQDKTENFYIYEEEFTGKKQRGLVTCCAIDDYENETIKRHELTRAEKEEDRIKHIDACDANTGPIFLTYKTNNSISNMIDSYCEKVSPIYNFVSEDNVRHKVWIIEDEILKGMFIKKFESVENLYIADGHHRTASAIKVGEMRRKQNLEYTGEEEFNFFLAVLFPEEQLQIIDYNRVVRVEDDFKITRFVSDLKQRFYVKMLGSKKYKPMEPKKFGMCIKGTWYELTAKKGSYDPKDSIKSLDVSILEENILKSILGIEDVRTDKNIDFVGGIRGLDELERRVTSDMDIAFAMYPTSIEELIRVADEGKVMPPKSTWFEPKLRSGLFIHKLK